MDQERRRCLKAQPRATYDRLYEFACHEGNYSMGNTLRGARYLEQQHAEQQHGW